MEERNNNQEFVMQQTAGTDGGGVIPQNPPVENAADFQRPEGIETVQAVAAQDAAPAAPQAPEPSVVQPAAPVQGESLAQNVPPAQGEPLAQNMSPAQEAPYAQGVPSAPGATQTPGAPFEQYQSQPQQTPYPNNGMLAGNQAFNKPEAPKKKLSKKLIIILAAVAVVVIAAVIIIVVSVSKGNALKKLEDKVSARYPKAYITVGSDGSYLMVDTNPYDEDYEDLGLTELQEFIDVTNDSTSAIEMINSELGFPGSVMQNMNKTTALQGRQTAEASKYRASWTYHPDHGLEVMYEKK